MNFLFISRHKPTDSQIELAKKDGITIEWHGDADAFSLGPGFVDEHGAFDGVIVVHPAAALSLAPSFLVGVFENANRAAIGEKPCFEAQSLKIFDLRD